MSRTISRRPMTRLNRIKVLNGYAAHGRFLAETLERPVGEIPRQPDIPSPYAYSPRWTVWSWHGRPVVVTETRHRRYEVFEVPAASVEARKDGAR